MGAFHAAALVLSIGSNSTTPLGSSGVIDSDYYYSDNEGHIFAKVTNDSKEGKSITVEAGAGFMQAIFIPYGITYDDRAEAVRNGGMGSTDNR